ncbi:hypothetical protein DFH06DRAFT_1134471 [Mycena polygramma]|nr:hypothetical protein DFH06DRAFT_1134471 [Mycena polygramma]
MSFSRVIVSQVFLPKKWFKPLPWVYTERLGGDERMEITRKTERLEGGGDDGDGVELDRYTLNSESWTTMVYEPSSLMVTGRGIKQMSVRRHLVSVTTLGNHQGCNDRLTLTLELQCSIGGGSKVEHCREHVTLPLCHALKLPQT